MPQATDMGRPWWYDSYWEKQGKPPRRARLPRRPFWVWTALIAISLLLTAVRTDFSFGYASWGLGFIYYMTRILSWVIIGRAILSWFSVRYSILIFVLDDLSEPILYPLRRIIPTIGGFDITPAVAILVLYLIPMLAGFLLG